MAQLYIHPETGGMFRPEQELKGFRKIALNPGEEKEVTITLCDRSFAVWSVAENKWVTEPGTYEIRVGSSSRDIRLSEKVVKQGAVVTNPYQGDCFAPYYKGMVQYIPDESFAALLGHEIPNAMWDRSAPIGFNDTISQGEYLSGGLGRHIYKLISFVHNVLMAAGAERTGQQCDVCHEPSLARCCENVRRFVGCPGAGTHRYY